MLLTDDGFYSLFGRLLINDFRLTHLQHKTITTVIIT